MAGRRKKPTKRKKGKKTELDESKLKKIIDKKLINAMSHPAREHVLATLNERVVSPNEVAKEIGVDVNYISYHFEELEKNGFSELVGVEPRRGFEEHFYRAQATFLIDDRECARLPASMRSAVGADLCQSILDDAIRALKAGTFAARDDVHVSWSPILIDEKGFGDLSAILNEALGKVRAVQIESTKRLAETGEAPIPATVGIVGFQTPDPALQTAGASVTT